MGVLLFAFANGLEVMAFIEGVILEAILSLELLFAYGFDVCGVQSSHSVNDGVV
jgi:hypothetical protein